MRIEVVAHPNSKHPRLTKDFLGILHIYVSEPALDGKANGAVVEALSKYYKTSKSNISLITGLKSKNKLFEISLP